MKIYVDKPRFIRDITNSAMLNPRIGDIFDTNNGYIFHLIDMKMGNYSLFKEYVWGSDPINSCQSELIIMPSFRYYDYMKCQYLEYKDDSSYLVCRKYEIINRKEPFKLLCNPGSQTILHMFANSKVSILAHSYNLNGLNEFLRFSAIMVNWISEAEFLVENEEVATLIKLSNPEIKFSEKYYEQGFLKSLIN